MAVMVIICMGRLPLLYIPKTLCVTFWYFLPETIVLGMLWVMTENFEQLTWYNNTLRNDGSDTYINCYVCNILGPEDNG